MKVIYKYPIADGLGTITLPCDKANLEFPEVLAKVVMQNHRPYLYASVNPHHPDTIELHTLLVGTGQPLPINYSEWSHIDTVQDGPFVWHVFMKDDEGSFEE